MDTQTALRHVAKIEYAVLRAPLHLVDEQVVQRFLDADSPLRQAFERALGALDEAVENCLRDPETVDVMTSPNRDEPTEQHEPVEQDPGPADDSEAAQIDHLTDELLEAEQTESFTGELAEDDALRQVQAELQAKRLIEEQKEK